MFQERWREEREHRCEDERERKKSDEERGRLKQTLVEITKELASQCAGYGRVLRDFGPSGPEDRNPRWGKIESCLQEFERMRIELHKLGDDQLASALRKDCDELRLRVYPQVREKIEKLWESPENRGRLGDPIWMQTLLRESSSLEHQGASFQRLANALEKLG